MADYLHSFVVDIRDTPTRKNLEIEASCMTDAVQIANRFMRESAKHVIIRRVKGFQHGKPIRWARDRDREWQPVVFYDQYASGTSVPRGLKKGTPCLFTV